ncbi:hypothetical protein FDP41_000239 [Naegleria fowleri]|uniref:DM10 domain-containing protein n=1 Tax=Naegleria fowleri TaxID=5763 RepID=A0A6A5CI90_NAEFO|nr:uncharacterized protein FDP41_000239 [Naegleria fowleri]KAF0985200.1 hypothetical protein FDP41_000239 [Naegleria fowleri]CAG4714262.1 unnamed protein product [Naegleria fowleri]
MDPSKFGKESERYAFMVTYYDSLAGFDREYHLLYYTFDETIEMYDTKTKRVFLKRSKYPEVALKDLYKGAIVTINSRQLKVKDYSDEFTRNNFGSRKKHTLAMIKPDGVVHMGEIIDRICKEGFQISKMKMTQLSIELAQKFYAIHKEKSFYDDPIIALELVAEDAVTKWRELIGPTDCVQARQVAPNSIRALYATDKTHNAVHGSDSDENATIESQFFFGGKEEIPTTATFENCSLAILLPHIVSDKASIGQIILDIQRAGLDITALELVSLGKTDASDFLEVYRGVAPDFQKMVLNLCSGPVIALEVSSKQPIDVVTTLRNVCGPPDPELAKAIRPDTIRAKYGVDKIRNAVHCTDLEDDGVLEVEFFFNLMQQ